MSTAQVSQHRKSMATLEEPTVKIKTEADRARLAEFVDLTGLVYDLQHPIIMVGLPSEEYVKSFGREFVKGEPFTIKKKMGNKTYVRFSRVMDVYRVCLALDGKTKIHQKAVRAILDKLEGRFGKDKLKAALRG